MFGLHAGINAVLLHRTFKIFIADLRKLGASNRLALIFQNAQLLCNSNCGILVISRDHHCADARLLAFFNRVHHFRANGVYHPGQAKKCHALLELRRFKALRALIMPAYCRPQHTQCVLCHSPIGA